MDSTETTTYSAIVVAAGLSTRMGRCKQLLPYGKLTVIEQIVSVLLKCGLDEVVVVIGHNRQAIEAKLALWPVRSVFNPNYQSAEMLSSVQCGLSALNPERQATLIVLGDQPQLEMTVIRKLIQAHRNGGGRLIIPSYQMRRGHPIVIDQAYWPEILALPLTETLRSVINTRADEIHYVSVDTDSVLRDMDTPEAYQRELHLLAQTKPSPTSST